MDPGQFGAVGGRDRRADRTVALSYTGVVTQTACWEERSHVCDEIRLTLAEVRRRTPSAEPAWGPRGTTPRLTVRGTTAGAPPPPRHAHCTLCIAHCTLYTVYCTLHTVCYKLHTAHCNAHCTRCIAHAIHTAHCTLCMSCHVMERQIHRPLVRLGGRPSAERLADTHTRTPTNWAPGEGGPRAP